MSASGVRIPDEPWVQCFDHDEPDAAWPMLLIPRMLASRPRLYWWGGTTGRVLWRIGVRKRERTTMREALDAVGVGLRQGYGDRWQTHDDIPF